MAKTEFEEREYETALYHELGSMNNHLWAPGQVLEALIGFDYSTYTQNPKFWNAVGMLAPPPGHVPNAAVPPFQNLSRPVPNFSLNLFIQAKRPHSHRLKAEAKLAAQGLGSPCWKFNIYQAQQARLKMLAAAAGPDALVCYAAPVFHTALDLYAATLSGTVIDKSTFPSALPLGIHSAWNYSQAGIGGVANTEPERIVEARLDQRVLTLMRERGQLQTIPPLTALERLRTAADSSSEAEISSLSARRRTKYLALQKEVDALRPLGDEKAMMMVHCLHLMNYSNAFGTKWLVISPEADQPLGES